MGEYTLILIGLIAVCLLVSLLYARKPPQSAQLFDQQPKDYAVTIWADQAHPDLQSAKDTAQPHRITVEYLASLQANSPEELANAQAEFSRQCNADFHQRFIPALGPYHIGAVHCQPANERE